MHNAAIKHGLFQYFRRVCVKAIAKGVQFLLRLEKRTYTNKEQSERRPYYCIVDAESVFTSTRSLMISILDIDFVWDSFLFVSLVIYCVLPQLLDVTS